MKKRHIIIVSLVLLVALIWLGLHQAKQRKAGATSNPHSEIEQTTSVQSTVASDPTTGPPGFPSQATNHQITEELRATVRAALDASKEEWRTPIEFYGQVLDEQRRPVPGVSVNFMWNDLSPTGTSQTNTTSDEQGLFSLIGVTGKGLSVNLSKAGYNVVKTNQNSFDYGAGYRSSASRPEVFFLRKRGTGVDLLTSQYGVFDYLDVNVPRDGTPIKVDLLNRKFGSEGQMELSSTKPPRGERATNWMFRLAIPNGGFVEVNEEFPFEAPESGYQPVVEFDFRAGQTNWADRIRKQYYVAFGEPRKYGRVSIDTGAYIGVRLRYVVNPDGSRNLEPKE